MANNTTDKSNYRKRNTPRSKKGTAAQKRGRVRVALKRANPRQERGLPYQERLGKRSGIVLWRVDGAYIRTNIDEEFSDYGHHYTYPYIPKGEFWVDQNTPEETEFFVRHMLTEYRLMEQGKSQDDAREQADQVEAEERRKAGDVERVRGENKLADPEKVHLRLLKKLETPVSVWIVNGRLVRSVFDQDFTEGGHEHVYEYVPGNEVWIDDQVTDQERPYVILHELHERNLMEKGWDYDAAHADSSKLEKHMRHHPEELHQALSNEGWE
ncbi:MAG: hypothetical protein ACM3JD_13935 [Rudaea sp.]